MILYCVRHAESLFNAEGRIQGQLDVALSERGRWQAQALCQSLLRLEPDLEAVYCSPLLRATDTATPIAEALNLPLLPDPRLQEIHAGIFQGMTFEEMAAQYPSETQRWRSHDPDFLIPGGESRRDLGRRGHAALEAVRQAGHRRALVVSHGGLLAAAFKELLEIPARHSPFRLMNAALNQLEWDGGVRLNYLNRADHLVRREPGAQGELVEL